MSTKKTNPTDASPLKIGEKNVPSRLFNCRVMVHNMTEKEIAAKITEIENANTNNVEIANQVVPKLDWINRCDTMKIVMGENTFFISQNTARYLLQLPLFLVDNSSTLAVQNQSKMTLNVEIAKNDEIDCLIDLFSHDWMGSNNQVKHQLIEPKRQLFEGQIENCLEWIHRSDTIKIVFGKNTYFITPSALRSMLFPNDNTIPRPKQSKMNQLIQSTVDPSIDSLIDIFAGKWFGPINQRMSSCIDQCEMKELNEIEAGVSRYVCVICGQFYVAVLNIFNQ